VIRLQQLATYKEGVGLVGHSFGGLLLREAIAQVNELRVNHLIMLGTPNQPSRLASKFYTRWPFRLFRGNCGECLSDPTWYRKLPALTHPYTIVAGTAGWRGRLSPFNGEMNDGLVSVSETKMNEDDQPILIPALHTFIMNSRSVHHLILERL
jgi:pimeloyl-ACP methyl ester carboxylesterase